MRMKFKNLFKDSNKSSKDHFFYKFILPGLCIFFFWGFIGHQILINFGENNLLAHNGIIKDIGIKFEQGTRERYKYYPLKIRLDNNIEYRLQDLNEDLFPNILSNISTGDYITIYTRKNWLSTLSWGRKIDFYKIEKNNKEILSFSSSIRSKKSQSNILGIFCLVLIPWYVIYRIKSNKASR